ncbi:MAG: hypothetical protein KME59_00470 [Trichormus sp. ATA11-4-KO1]|jgi:hypothetical protein|nr:hypothetical protein [Trichormus sp. ATA11-4-KO1]
MKIKDNQQQTTLLSHGLCLLLTLTTFVFPANAQSKDRDNPTPLTSNVVTGQVGKDDTSEYFYSFIAGPGEVTVTLDVLPERNSLSITVDLFDTTNAKELLSFRKSSVEFHSAREIRRIQFNKQQPVVMRVRWNHFNKTGGYKVRLDGAVKFANTQSPTTGTNTSVLTVPNQGMLRIEMDDGTTQEFNLNRVRRVLIQQ